MSASSRTVPATSGMGPIVAVFAALLAGTALIVALASGQLTASQTSLAPAAAPAPAVVHDHGWSSASSPLTLTTPDTYARGWGSTVPAIRGNEFSKAHAPNAATQVEERGFGSNRVRFAQ
jgi:hypothetical protein